MKKERLVLQDGSIDISGPYITYSDRETIEEGPVLPYTIQDITEAKHPAGFMDFLKSNFENIKTIDTLLYYLSLIPACNTEYKYGGFFIGPAMTGKSVLIEILRNIYPGFFVGFVSDCLINTKKKSMNAIPEIAQIEGKGAAIIHQDGRGNLNTSLWKVLTGGDTITARALYREPRQFSPTAQIIVVSNFLPYFDVQDEAIVRRLLFIPFSKRHEREDPGTMLMEKIIDYLRPEFPAIVHLLAEYYITLKHKLLGTIPQSRECRSWKKQFFQEAKN